MKALPKHVLLIMSWMILRMSKKAMKKVVAEALAAASHSNEEMVKQKMRKLQDAMLSNFRSLEERKKQAADASEAQLKELQTSLKGELDVIKGGIDTVLDRVTALRASQKDFQESLNTMQINAALGDKKCQNGLVILENCIKDAFETNKALQLDRLKALGTDVSNTLHDSIVQIIAPYKADSSKDSADLQHELLKEMFEHIKEIKAQICGNVQAVRYFHAYVKIAA